MGDRRRRPTFHSSSLHDCNLTSGAAGLMPFFPCHAPFSQRFLPAISSSANIPHPSLQLRCLQWFLWCIYRNLYIAAPCDTFLHIVMTNMKWFTPKVNMETNPPNEEFRVYTLAWLRIPQTHNVRTNDKVWANLFIHSLDLDLHHPRAHCLPCRTCTRKMLPTRGYT